jgi:hypothetical protein
MSDFNVSASDLDSHNTLLEDHLIKAASVELDGLLVNVANCSLSLDFQRQLAARIMRGCPFAITYNDNLFEGKRVFRLWANPDPVRGVLVAVDAIAAKFGGHGTGTEAVFVKKIRMTDVFLQ